MNLQGITIFIRKKPNWINYVNSVQEFKQFIESLVSNQPIIIGDLAQFSQPMKNLLLKLLEERNNVSLYSSSDIVDPILMSRIAFVEKEPLILTQEGLNLDAYNDSPKDYQSVYMNLSVLSDMNKMRAVKLNSRMVNLLLTNN
jgi:hypothetical protein